MLQAARGRIATELGKVIVGQEAVIEQILIALFAGGHCLITGAPGLAKTLLVKSIAQIFHLEFRRIQFTPDLMPTDITGVEILQETEEGRGLVFVPGPIFGNMILADEINRTPPKTQAALLEAMQERQVTIDGTTHPLDRPFIVLATQNPIEYEGTYPLPEAQLDRFLLRIGIGYPSPEDEWRMLLDRAERRTDEVQLQPIVDARTLIELQGATERVFVSDSVARYIVDLVDSTRKSARIQVGSSPRGTLALLKLARARAALAGRDFVIPEDVKAVAVPALAHRLTLRPELWVQRVRGEDVVRESLASVPTPPAESAAEESERREKQRAYAPES